MIKVFVMFVVISNGFKAGVTATHVEFTSHDKCVAALNDTIKQTDLNANTRVVSSGCYEK